jgi:hypothetical protein
LKTKPEEQNFRTPIVFGTTQALMAQEELIANGILSFETPSGPRIVEIRHHMKV